MDDLTDRIRKIMHIGVWEFDGLPRQIIMELNELIELHNDKVVLSALKSLVGSFEEAERRARSGMGNSGIAGEWHMAAAMRLKYIKESVAYAESRRLS